MKYNARICLKHFHDHSSVVIARKKTQLQLPCFILIFFESHDAVVGHVFSY